jgi:hypothetical protein
MPLILKESAPMVGDWGQSFKECLGECETFFDTEKNERFGGAPGVGRFTPDDGV